MLPNAFSADTRIELLRLRLPQGATLSDIRIVGTAHGFGWGIRVEGGGDGTFFTNYQACCAGRLTGRELLRVIESARIGEHGPHLLEFVLEEARSASAPILVDSRTHPETAAFVRELVETEASRSPESQVNTPGSPAGAARSNPNGREIAVDFAD